MSPHRNYKKWREGGKPSSGMPSQSPHSRDNSDVVLRGMMPWSTSCSLVLLCCSLSWSTVGRKECISSCDPDPCRSFTKHPLYYLTRRKSIGKMSVVAMSVTPALKVLRATADLKPARLQSEFQISWITCRVRSCLKKGGKKRHYLALSFLKKIFCDSACW